MRISVCQDQIGVIRSPGRWNKIAQVSGLLHILNQELVSLVWSDHALLLVATFSEIIARVNNSLDVVEAAGGQTFEEHRRVFLCLLLEWHNVDFKWKTLVLRDNLKVKLLIIDRRRRSV